MLSNTRFEDFGKLVFSKKKMKQELPSPVYKKWKETVRDQATLDRETADAIAHAMKKWALSNGCTHFTHWFHPLTGTTAEKHDSFIEPDEHNLPILRFSGKSLIKGEPDASSFPSGGLRATFEARGYTYWDFTSPAFIYNDVLCIPTVFVSYNGESLDKKAPLLKSAEALNKAATKLVNLLSKDQVKAVSSMVGLEQEYFLVDKKLYDQREDLKLCNRTLFGCKSPKGQDNTNHYFGSIPAKVASFMQEVNTELWKLGVYIKTEHNEVAPAQFEICSVYAKCNIAVDQNYLVMDVLKRVANRHGLECILHEKPFNHANGSGKHNNWSLVTNDGQNLFEPGENPAENIRFLTFVCAFIKAVDQYPVLLRMAASSPANDHRLGAHEAPPAIMSIFMGSYLENILNSMISCANIDECKKEDFNPIRGLSYIPKDNTDRNRTSPLAFTGNKFEFRMLGSSQSAGFINTVLNTIMASELTDIADKIEKKDGLASKNEAALEICQQILKDHHRILFSGDGYSSEWVEEAHKRGLPNIESFIESVGSLDQPEVIELFNKTNVLSSKELQSRISIYAERYINVIKMEVDTMIDLIRHDFEPAVIQDMMLVNNIDNPVTNARYKKYDQLLMDMEDIVEKMESAKANLACNSLLDCGIQCRKVLFPLLEEARCILDSYEDLATSKNYPCPRYSQLMFN